MVWKLAPTNGCARLSNHQLLCFGALRCRDEIFPPMHRVIGPAIFQLLEDPCLILVGQFGIDLNARHYAKTEWKKWRLSTDRQVRSRFYVQANGQVRIGFISWNTRVGSVLTHDFFKLQKVCECGWGYGLGLTERAHKFGCSSLTLSVCLCVFVSMSTDVYWVQSRRPRGVQAHPNNPSYRLPWIVLLSLYNCTLVTLCCV